MQFTCPACETTFEHERPADNQAVVCPECGFNFFDKDATVIDRAGPVPGWDLQPGKELDGFLIQERIGLGGMGEVYKAVQLSLDRTVVVKILPRAFAERPLFVKRFHEESSALSALNHPNIVTIYERGHLGNLYFFAMEYVDGVPLDNVTWDRADVGQFLHVAKGTAAALSYAHERGVIHRDIKPANIMLSSRNEVKVADFGLASLVAEERPEPETRAGARAVRMGTPAYMSPEQKRNPEQVDGRTDIYSAGVVFFELLIGERPALPVEKLPGEVSELADPRLDPVVARCLAQDPDRRYQTAQSLLEDLQRFGQELEQAPPCPECGNLSPVRKKSCVYCGRNLEQFFDICPECKEENRRDVHHCLYCGVDLQKGRTIISEKVTMMLDQADRLRLDGDYEEALEILDDVSNVEGRVFESDRQRAETLRQKALQDRAETAQRYYSEAKRMVKEQRFREAVELFKRVPQAVRDTTEDIRRTRELQARLAAQRRSQTKTNLILILVAMVLVFVLLLFAFL